MTARAAQRPGRETSRLSMMKSILPLVATAWFAGQASTCTGIRGVCCSREIGPLAIEPEGGCSSVSRLLDVEIDKIGSSEEIRGEQRRGRPLAALARDADADEGGVAAGAAGDRARNAESC